MFRCYEANVSYFSSERTIIIIVIIVHSAHREVTRFESRVVVWMGYDGIWDDTPFAVTAYWSILLPRRTNRFFTPKKSPCRNT